MQGLVDLGKDVWSHSPLSFTSSFRILANTSSPAGGYHWCVGVPFASKLYGFGWKYEITLEGPPTGGPDELMLRLWFDSHSIAGVKCGSLTLTIKQQLRAVSGAQEGARNVTRVSVDPEFPKWTLVDCGYLSNLSAENSIEITVQFPTSGVVPPNPARTMKMLDMMTGTIETGQDTIDTKFFLFSRGSGKRASCPRPLYASSALVKGWASYLDSLLSVEGFRESQEVDLDTTGPSAESTEEYDYDSDSDLDPDDDDETEPYIRPDLASRGRSGRVITLKHTAFHTWNAFLHYLYTEKCRFRPLSSQQSDAEVLPTSCSPKSMYRLADEMGLPALKKLAFYAIKESISVDNIAKEVFSKFTSLYPEVQEFQVDFLVKNIKKVKDFKSMLKTVTAGTLPHSHAVLEKVIDRLSEGVA